MWMCLPVNEIPKKYKEEFTADDQASNCISARLIVATYPTQEKHPSYPTHIKLCTIVSCIDYNIYICKNKRVILAN